jgi:hypothetical protein
MSKALSSDQKVIDRWLGAQLIDRPNPSDHADYTTLLGNFNSPLKSVRELLETIINQSEWSWEIERSLQQLGTYFDLPDDWWKNRDGFGVWHLDAMATAFADSWIYRNWLRDIDQSLSEAYSQFFASSVMHPEWCMALERQWNHHPSIGGNLFEILPHAGELMYPEDLKGSPWYPNYRQKLGKELIHRAIKAEEWLRDVFTASDQEKSQKLESGLSHMSLAAMKGDASFFIGLGKALSEKFEARESLSLNQIQNQPTSKSRKGITTRQWCRRIWISRGLWLLPTHLLQHSPFSLSQATISELTGKRYKDNKKLNQNDELYKTKTQWFNEWQNESSSISLTLEGKKMLPQFAKTGLLWTIVSSDFV